MIRMRLRWKLRFRLVVLFAIAAGVAIGGIAYASIPDSDGVIHARFKKASPNQGLLRVIDTERGQTCSGAENAVDWNAVGPQGIQGPPGISGYQVVGDGTNTAADGRALYEGVVTCPTGKSVLGGGGSALLTGDDFSLRLDLVISEPSGDGGLWRLGFMQSSGFPIDSGEVRIIAYAICASVSA
jgi:hypothetical protein